MSRSLLCKGHKRARSVLKEGKEAGVDVLATRDADLPHRQNREGCEPAFVRLSLGVEHEKDAEYDQQKGRQPCEDHVPASG